MLFTVVESKWEFQELINFCPSLGSHLIGNFQFDLKSGIMFFKEREMERMEMEMESKPTMNLSALLEDNRLPSHMIASLLQEFYKSYMKE